MNQIIAGGFAFILALFLWSIGKKPKKIPTKLPDLNEQIPMGLVQKSLNREQRKQRERSKIVWNPPKTEKERISLKKNLFKLIKSNPEERLYAVQIATKWGDSCTLPILRQGLRDSDSRIVLAAAEAIEKYKQHPLICSDQLSFPSPRNVFLMR